MWSYWHLLLFLWNTVFLDWWLKSFLILFQFYASSCSCSSSATCILTQKCRMLEVVKGRASNREATTAGFSTVLMSPWKRNFAHAAGLNVALAKLGPGVCWGLLGATLLEKLLQQPVAAQHLLASKHLQLAYSVSSHLLQREAWFSQEQLLCHW